MAQPRFLGERLRAAREAAGLSREELTLALGLSSPMRIKHWESGVERPQPRFVPPLAAAVNIEPLLLLDADPDDPPLAALRIAAGIATRQMGVPGMSAMTYQRLENGYGGGAEHSQRAIEAIGAAFAIDATRVRAAIRRARTDRAGPDLQ